ncbi:MAG: hypothetical protein HKN56_02210 [Gammaproteobacteria bacterium]|nr:hypothetical protein [Gammaproteobacteria bacterium]
MTRFNITIVLACVLLAMLLWIVRSTVGEWTNPQPLVIPDTVATESQAVTFDPDLPVISSGASLAAYLRENGLGGAPLLNDLQIWRLQRGFPDDTHWPTQPLVTQNTGALSATADGAELLQQAAAGNMAAMHRLAENSKFENPVEALDWFDMAMVNGSLYAMLRTADLLASLGDPALAGFRSDPVFAQALNELQQATPPPRVRSLAWSIAAITAGGFALLDASHADRISSLTADMDAANINKACELAQSFVLETAMARRARGGAVFSTDRPLFAVSVADPQDVLPCEIPVQPLVDLSGCITEPFVGPGRRLWQMYFCPSP